MSKKISVTTGSLEEAAKEFIDVWYKVENGQQPEVIEKISFKDQRLLFKTLTPKRFEILRYTHEQQDGMSIRSLAKQLGRDYSNVHQDVKILYQLGLMIKDEKNDKYYVPWDVIVTEISLPVIKKTKTHRHAHNQSIPRAAHG